MKAATCYWQLPIVDHIKFTGCRAFIISSYFITYKLHSFLKKVILVQSKTDPIFLKNAAHVFEVYQDSWNFLDQIKMSSIVDWIPECSLSLLTNSIPSLTVIVLPPNFVFELASVDIVSAKNMYHSSLKLPNDFESIFFVVRSK